MVQGLGFLLTFLQHHLPSMTHQHLSARHPHLHCLRSPPHDTCHAPPTDDPSSALLSAPCPRIAASSSIWQPLAHRRRTALLLCPRVAASAVVRHSIQLNHALLQQIRPPPQHICAALHWIRLSHFILGLFLVLSSEPAR
jgi:hypothetical protein